MIDDLKTFAFMLPTYSGRRKPPAHLTAYLLFFILLTVSGPGFAQESKQAGYHARGRLIDVGGYKMHLNKQGAGSPAVILIAGSSAFSFDWYFVQKAISRITTAVSYDRPGLAWSDPGPMPRTMKQDVYELHTLLFRSGIKPPYILAGHSIGGLIARLYAKAYPDQVAGMVLVDPTSEDAVLFVQGKLQKVRLLAVNTYVPPVKKHPDSLTKLPSQKDIDDLEQFMGKPVSEYPFTLLPKEIQRLRIEARKARKFQIADGGDFTAAEMQNLYTDSLHNTFGNKPLIVLASGKNDFPKELDSLYKPGGIKALYAEKIAQKKKMAALSTDGKFVLAANNIHEIQIENPELVIKAIREVICAYKTKKHL